MTSVIFLLLFNFMNVAQSEDAAFSVRIRLLKPIVTTVVQPLSFPDTMAGSSSSVVVSSTADSAAQVDVQGGANRTIHSYVVENSIAMTSPSSSSNVRVDGFSVKSPTAFDSTGKAKLSVGATAHILASNEDANYAGNATLRVIYQ